MLREIDSITELDEVFGADIAVLYKHSPFCGASRWARDEVLEFVQSHPGTPVFEVNVVRQRQLSQEIARRVGIRHQSPQVIVLRSGVPAWDTSHSGITSGALARAIEDAGSE